MCFFPRYHSESLGYELSKVVGGGDSPPRCCPPNELALPQPQDYAAVVKGGREVGLKTGLHHLRGFVLKLLQNHQAHFEDGKMGVAQK